MLPIESLQLIKPEDAAPGAVLVANAGYNRPPLFCCTARGKACAFSLADPADHGFSIAEIVAGSQRWLQAGAPMLLVDHR